MIILEISGKKGWQMILLCILEVVSLYALTPRFILSIRVLYARSVQGRRGEGIGNGSGLSECSPSCDTRGTMIVFDGRRQGSIERRWGSSANVVSIGPFRHYLP